MNKLLSHSTNHIKKNDDSSKNLFYANLQKMSCPFILCRIDSKHVEKI